MRLVSLIIGPGLIHPIAWTVFWIAWFTLGQRQHAPMVKVPRLHRTLNLLAVVFAFVLLLDPQFQIGPFAAVWNPPTSSSMLIGTAIFLAGIGIMWWARVHLGVNWSSNVAIDERHELVTSGPYAFVRHPIYTGLLIAMLGTAVTVGRAGSVLGVILASVAYVWKATQEEVAMEDRFGADYEKYRGRTKMLIPGLL